MKILTLIAISIVFISGCGDPSALIEQQRDKEIDVIEAQKEKEIEVMEREQGLRIQEEQRKRALIELCVNDAAEQKNKRLNVLLEVWEIPSSDLSDTMAFVDMVEVKCRSRYPKTVVECMNTFNQSMEDINDEYNEEKSQCYAKPL